MKKYISVLITLICICQMNSQILYDNGPIDDSNNFSLNGKKWNYTNLKYYFENGTNDILDNNERNAITQAMQIWTNATSLTFTEVTDPTSADIVIKWATGDHGDGSQNAFGTTGGVLAHAFYPPPNSGSLAGGCSF